MELESRRLAGIAPSATIRMSELARKMRTEGRRVISLATGEPDFDTPPNIRQAAIRAIEQGRTKYTEVDGIPELKIAAAAKFSRDNGLAYQPSEINVSPGAKFVIFNALSATLSPGDEVLIPAPYYVSYPDMVRLAGGTPVIVRPSPDCDLKITPQQLEASIGSRTKWFILNSPSNPTGSVYTREELQALASVLLQYPRIMILADDIYEHILFDGREFVTMAQAEPRLRDRCLTVNGVSKAYAMTGWRIGYCGGPAPLISLMRKMMGQTTSNACSIAQWAALEALRGPQDSLKVRQKIYDERRRLVVDSLNQSTGLSCSLPAGAFYAFANCSGQLGRRSPSGKIISSDEDFALDLLQSEGVAIVAGSAFGMPGYFRASFATETAVLEKACERIRRFCSRTAAV